MPEFNEKDASRFYRWLGHKEEEFTEIRAIQWPPKGQPKRIWVQNEKDFIAFCKTWNGKRQVYVGVNPRFQRGGANEDVVRRVAIPLDVDSKRPSNDVAATEKEVAAAKERMVEINSWMRLQGYKQPFIAMSGNGYHIVQRVDIPVTEDLPKKLESYFYNEIPHADKMDKILDAARILKVPGTISIKGVPTEERPHRLSYIVNVGDPVADEVLRDHITGLSPYQVAPEIYIPPEKREKEKKKRRTSDLKTCFKRFAEEGGELSANGEEDNNLRLALVQEAHSKGYSRNEIIELFSGANDFGDGKITTYNVDRILKKISQEGQKVWGCLAIYKHSGCLGETCKRYAKQIANKLNPEKTKKKGDEEEYRKKESLALLGAKYVFATPDDVEILYLYQEGKYVPAKTIIHAEIEAQHGDDSSSGLCAAVVGHFKRRSYVKRSEFNKFDNFMPVANGLLNLTTFELTPHTPNKIFTFKLETAYLPGKKCPKFMKYYTESLPNQEAQQVVQEFSGYTLLPAFPHHYFLFMIGEGRNGKGTLMRTLTGILGVENVAAVPLDQLDGKHRFVVATLFGKLMNICSEPSTKELHPQILKKVTGQDLVHGEIKNKQNPLNFIPFAKWFVLANKLPPVNDTTLSFWDRLQLVEYTQSFTDEKGNKITDIERQWLDDPDERAGVLNWMIGGLKRLQEQGGITQTKTMKQKKLEYKKASDSIGAFLLDAEQCMYGSILWILRDDLYDAYKNYAEEQGITIENTGKFVARVKLLPNVVARKKRIKGKNERIWKGISLVSPTTKIETPLDLKKILTPKNGADGADGTPAILPFSPPLSPIYKTREITDREKAAPIAPSAPLKETTPTDPLKTTPDENAPPESEIIEDPSPDPDSPGEKMAQYALDYLRRMGGSLGQIAFNQAMVRGGYHEDDVDRVLGMDPRFNFDDGIVSIRKRARA